MRWFNTQPRRSKLQQEALETALGIYNSDPEGYKDTMFCPYCGQPLVKSGFQRRMETLSEHVSDPNGTPSLKDEYICGAETLFEGRYLFEGEYPNAPLGCKFGILHSWNGGAEKGESFMSNFCRELCELRKKSITNKLVIDEYFKGDDEHKLEAALNTFSCKLQIEGYHEGLKDSVRLPAWLTFNFIQLVIRYDYVADNFGRVIATYIHLEYLKKDKCNGFSYVGAWPWDTWRFLLREFKRKRNLANRQSNLDKKMNSLRWAYSHSFNRAWIYRAFEWYIQNVRHPFEYRRVVKYFYT